MKRNKTNRKEEATPFVKWAGGKTQLLDHIEKIIYNTIKDGNYTYVEPFVGGGAVFFRIIQKFPGLIKTSVINDINSDLITAYKTIKTNVEDLISELKKYEEEYYATEANSELRKELYLKKRARFNERNSNDVEQTALFIFLNKTCFNGLYRVNKKNKFNVPIGNYKRPTICDEENLRLVNKVLQSTIILNGDFEATRKFAGRKTIFYCDPPYKPISKTSGFTSYSSNDFTDNDQVRLAKFCMQAGENGASWIISNSDVKTFNNDDFFETLYKNYNIQRVTAKRYINSDASKRGEVPELLITNIKYEKTVFIA